MDQFNAGQPWDVVPGAKIEGGHYVPVVGTVHEVDQGTCVTWGKHQAFTKAFYEQYNDEAWAYITQEELHNGAGLHGFDVAKLNTYLSQVHA